MNKPIRRVSVFCMILVFALLLRTNWVQVVEADSLAKDQHNRRVLMDQYSYPRGNILVGGQPVTRSDLTGGYQYKYKRGYTDGQLYAAVTGYTSQVYGSNALENLENGILTGTDDRLFFRNTVDQLTGKQRQGGDVATTINPAVQKAAYGALNGKKGAAVAIDPRTGAILALVSTPSYDPGTIAGFTDSSAWNALNSDQNQPMLDRALRQTYPPGSTFKLVTAATAFETGKYQSPDDQTDTPDHFILPGTTTELQNDSPQEDCGQATLMHALTISCNTVYGKLGADLGKEKLQTQAEKFGFNNTVDTPIRSVKSVFPTDSTPDGTAMDAIGQHNTTATPLQMAMVAAAIADNGKLMQPYLVDEERSGSGTVISKHTESQLSQAVSPATAQKLQQMMVDVVQNGTGRNARINGVEVGGKTGTAQHGTDNKGLPFAWFVSYAKVGQDVPVAVAVVVEDGAAQSDEISGGSIAAPIAKQIMQAVIGR
ncbi:penicillin-binding protein [Streptomyces tateyamensis]|uniref:Penicillin-binding protein n=1 Tax=Streptomyces tateyamensis TaxID=565073 RepID=A0A2V4P9U7_9ACTN|nr:penicillin-binding transpeptidase domain-containing protein [Streptomyces tateyamensis]PYC87552.1 penicillin-binding protein [Streptomyces tateyamensis]